eukprot:269471_1
MLRRSCITLRRGEIYFRYVDDNIGGWLIYSRVYYTIEILIVINTDHNNYKQIPTQIDIDYDINKAYNGKKYLNVLSPLYINNPIITIPSNGYAIFVRYDQIDEYNQQYGIAFCRE